MEGRAEWDLTRKMKKRLASQEPKGYWQGRRIIARDCPINGGVYLGPSEREAIVVDDQKQPELGEVYEQLLVRARAREQEAGVPFKKGILSDVFETVREVMPYSSSVVKEITRALPPDRKISLSSFIINKGGECRHQALLCGYLLERLGKEGRIAGQVSVDRNFIYDKGAHAWVRYVNSAGIVYVIDPARKFIGRPEEAGKDAWLYQRPNPQK